MFPESAGTLDGKLDAVSERMYNERQFSRTWPVLQSITQSACWRGKPKSRTLLIMANVTLQQTWHSDPPPDMVRETTRDPVPLPTSGIKGRRNSRSHGVWPNESVLPGGRRAGLRLRNTRPAAFR